VDRTGVPTAIYHGVAPGVEGGICLASSDDDLLQRWTRHPANPVIPNPTAGDEYQVAGAPCAWVEGDTYYAITGGTTPPRVRPPITPGDYLGRADSRDVVYLFRSRDLEHWEYLHPFYEGGRFTEGGEDIGCPDFFPLGDRHVLLFTSHLRGAQYYVGRYADQRFVAQRHKRFTFAETERLGVFAEGLTLRDEQGRRILFGRVHEGVYGHVQRAWGWAGVITLPMVLTLSDQGHVQVAPVPELETLRREHREVADLEIAAGADLQLDGIGGDRLELAVSFQWQGAEEFGLKVRCSPDGQEQTLIRVRATDWGSHRDPLQPRRRKTELIVDASRSSVSPQVSDRGAQRCPLEVGDDGQVELRVFVDRSMVEVFAGGEHYLVKRVYPASRDATGVQLYARGGGAKLRRLDAWQMAPIWPLEA
jgi:beta-fructofuranosidase